MPADASDLHGLRAPDGVAIDRAIVGGASNRVIARHYAVSHDAVRLHRTHLSARLIRAREAEADHEADPCSTQMDEHLARARSVLDPVVPQQGRVRAFEAAAALREVRETLMAIGKLTGEGLHMWWAREQRGTALFFAGGPVSSVEENAGNIFGWGRTAEESTIRLFLHSIYVDSERALWSFVAPFAR